MAIQQGGDIVADPNVAGAPYVASFNGRTGTVSLVLADVTTALPLVVQTTTVQTLTHKRITKRVVTVTPAAAPAINTDNTDVASIVGQNAAITNMSTNLTGAPVDGDELWIRITDDGTGRAITWGTKFEASTVALATTTVASAMLVSHFIWNVVTSKWRVVTVA